MTTTESLKTAVQLMFNQQTLQWLNLQRSGDKAHGEDMN